MLQIKVAVSAIVRLPPSFTETGVANAIETFLTGTALSAGDKVGPGEHNLAGKYIGGRASITIIKGVGARALVGGSNDDIALQPIATETGEGLGLSGGLSYLFLEAPKS